MLAQCGVLMLISGFLTHEDGYPRKPAPEMVQGCLQRYALAADDCVMIGDRPLDTRAGKAAGVRGILLDADGRFYCSDTDGAQPYGGTWCVVQNPMAGEDNFWISAESILVLNYSDSMTMRFGVDYIVSTTEEDGEGLTLPLVNLAYGEGGCTYVPYGAVDRYGNWVATADGSVRQMTLPIQ